MENEGIKESKNEFNQPEKIKEKIIKLLRNPYNFTLALTFLSIIILRFYYFWITKNQPIWWDESEYLSAAKAYAGIVDFKLASLRLPGFPLLMSIFYIMGINNEAVIRFFICFIPSILVLFVFYFLIKEMYSDKKVALISVIILGVLWENLFYSNRFQTENLSILFEFLALLIFFKVYMKKEKIYFITSKFSLLWVLVFSIMSFLIRPGNVTFLPSLVLFLIILNQSFFLKEKNKKFSYFLLVLFVVLAVFMLFNLKSIPIIGPNYHSDWKFGWVSLSVFNGFYDSMVPNIPSVFLYAFLLGLAIIIFSTLIMIDKIKEIYRDNNNLNFKSDLFNLILLFSVLFVFIFIIRPPAIEFRWFFMILPPILAFTSRGIIYFSEFIGDFVKKPKLAILIIILIVLIGAYSQIIHADNIIRQKLDSYSQVKDAGLWIKQNSESKDIIISASLPQNTYYSERKTFNFNNPENPFASSPISEKEFLAVLKDKKPKYYIASIFEPGLPQWTYELPEKNKQMFIPVQVYFADAEKKQAALVVYEYTYIPNSNTANTNSSINSISNSTNKTV